MKNESARLFNKPMDNIPNEILVHIHSYLPSVPDIRSCMFVCNNWYKSMRYLNEKYASTIHNIISIPEIHDFLLWSNTLRTYISNQNKYNLHTNIPSFYIVNGLLRLFYTYDNIADILANLRAMAIENIDMELRAKLPITIDKVSMGNDALYITSNGVTMSVRYYVTIVDGYKTIEITPAIIKKHFGIDIPANEFINMILSIVYKIRARIIPLRGSVLATDGKSTWWQAI